MIRRPPRSTLFPYTTLFRSLGFRCRILLEWRPVQSDRCVMETLRVELGERSYPIHIGSGLLDRLPSLLPPLHGKQILVVTNTTIAPLYLDQVVAGLTGFKVDTLVLPDGEQFKTLDTLNQIFTALLQHRHNRTTTLVALGGGVIGDIPGFPAAAYQRGVDFIQIPTTLLSQVDSSVGGKTGVNHPLGKNMIGAFHQPRCVIADTDTLNTLPERELAAGLDRKSTRLNSSHSQIS